MTKNKSRISYYEKTDFSDAMKKTKGRKVLPSVKRITINISDKIYKEANELDHYMSMGYQNVLKTAMTLGLTELYSQVASHSVSHK
ncbi:MAG: hypothetical protein JNL74_12735 [Fibrobacteres bacterium]|nr:hypothetical protein [Fibrobacterota bacterium]